MSDDHSHGATTIHASKGGGNAGKWLLGALAAVVVAGGGYVAWKTLSPDQTNTQTAYNDQYASEPVQAGPLPSDQSASVQINPASEGAAAPSSSETRSAARSRRAAAPAAAPAEETIGITPVSASVQEDENVTVIAPRRPVWSRVPSAQRLSSYYPEHAREVGREGEASLQCTVQGDGALDCARVSEFPAHAGFGNAALRVARGFRHSAQTASGADAAGSPVNLHVVFRMEDEPRRG